MPRTGRHGLTLRIKAVRCGWQNASRPPGGRCILRFIVGCAASRNRQNPRYSGYFTQRVVPAAFWHRNRITGGVVIAIPNCQGRVSPVFDVATRLTVVRLKGPTELERREVTLVETLPAGIARSVVELGVDVLICGAISRMLQVTLARAGLRVVPRICGEVETVLRAWREGTLGAAEFQMPGCCGRGLETRPARCRKRFRHQPQSPV